MSNLREISVDECRAVFGGNSDNEEPVITVSGRKLYYNSTLIWDYQQDIGFGSGVFGSTGSGGFGNLTLPEGWDFGWVDTNDDGVPDSPEIVVTASGTSAEANLAATIAARETDLFLAQYGFFFGAVGGDLAAALTSAGVPGIVANGLAGTAASIGVATSIPDILGNARSTLYEAVFQDALRDIHANPSQYSNWMQNPFTGNYFDANSAPYNQFD